MRPRLLCVSHLQRWPQDFGQKSPIKGFLALSSDHDWVINPAKKEQISVGLWGHSARPSCSIKFLFEVNGPTWLESMLIF